MLDLFQRAAVIPVLTIERVEDAVPLARALVRGGLNVLEVTLRTPAAVAAITAIAREVADAIVGAGTVLGAEEVGKAAGAGARFLVSPGLTGTLAEAAKASGLPLLPGAVTASEIMSARELGFSLLKFFPAAASGGIPVLRSFVPVFQGIAFCPTGGVTQENAGDYLALDNVAMVGGSWMVSAEAIRSGDWTGIADRAAKASALRGR